METINLDFVEINTSDGYGVQYTDTCSGERSDCCTRLCTRRCDSDEESLASWESYLEIVSGVIQY